MSTKIGPVRVGRDARGRGYASASYKGVTIRSTQGTPTRGSTNRLGVPNASRVSVAGNRTLVVPLPLVEDLPPAAIYPFGPVGLAVISMGAIVSILGTLAVAPLGYMLAFIPAAYGAYRDSEGFGTLRGWMRWQAMTRSKRFWASIAWIFGFPIMVAIYAVRVLMTNSAARAAISIQQTQTTPSIEAYIGSNPPPDVGIICPKCAIATVIGATYCHQCGADLKPKTTVCPHCATLNPQGSPFCTQCRTALSGFR